MLRLLTVSIAAFNGGIEQNQDELQTWPATAPLTSSDII